MTVNERLFLLDGMALAYRAYFAFISRPLINSKGENTSAIYGFATSLMKILDEEKPEHIAVVFDTKEPTFRHKVYPEYKATRQKMPEDMAASLDKLKDVVRAFNVPLIEIPGYEADDVMGTLARIAEKEKVTTYMVSGDKDFMQLISPFIKMYKPGKSGAEAEIIEEAGVLEKFGVTPDKVIDVLGLTGDSSDNVPGVKGIGEKTAIPLIQKYGSIEELLKAAGTIPQKGLREKLIADKEAALLSKKLVTIRTDVPLEIDFHQLRAARRDTKRLIQLFGELEFDSLLGKLRDTEPFVSTVAAGPEVPIHPELFGGHRAETFGAGPVNGAGQPQITEPGQITRGSPGAVPSVTRNLQSEERRPPDLVIRAGYHCITTLPDLEKLCARLGNAEIVAVCTHTTPTDPLRATLTGVSFCMKAGEAYYIPVDHTASSIESPNVLSCLKPIMEDSKIKKVGQNIKHDILTFRSHGIEMQGIGFDTMIGSYVLRADGQHDLEALAMEYFDYKMISIEDLPGKKNQEQIADVPLDVRSRYFGEAVDVTLRVYQQQSAKLKSLELLKLCEDVEFPLIPVLARMEFTGICLDVPYLHDMSKELDRQITTAVADIHRLAGESFNINSTQQLGDVLFNKLQLPRIRKTKTGFSTDVNVLEALRGQHPIIETLLEYRQLAKLKSTYIDALPQLLNPKTGRLHTSFNQTVAATGRLSSSDPNLQNIPIRTEIGRAIRKAFIPGGNDMSVMSTDYSQIELRIMAHICGDEGLVEAFRNREDIHASTAAKVFGVSQDTVTQNMRRKAKEVNFGIMYGIGPFGLANRLEISQTEAKEIIRRYFERFPKVKQYINDTIDWTRRTGYVSTVLGRRRYLPDINSRNHNVRGNAERQAINMPIQGTAADMIKLAMIHLDDALVRNKMKSRMLLQVHDELVFEVPNTEIETMRPLLIDKMKTALTLNVPIEVEVGVGGNWLEAH